MSRAPLMPKATAVWLVENTALSFRQIADYCNLHELEVKAATSQEASGRRKSDRSSCVGSCPSPCVGEFVSRRRTTRFATSAMTTTTTTIAIRVTRPPVASAGAEASGRLRARRVRARG